MLSEDRLYDLVAEWDRRRQKGELVSDEANVLSGLNGGELLATSGVHQLKEGMKVRRLKEKRK